MRVVLLQPPVQVEVVVLLRPEHAREGLAVDPALVLAERAGRDPVVELLGVEQPLTERLLERRSQWSGRRALGQPELDGLAAARRHLEHVACRGLRPGLLGVHRIPLPGDHVPMERVLDVRRWVRLAPQPLGVRLVLREQQLRGAAARERVLAQLGMRGHDPSPILAQDRLLTLVSPRPGVAEPQGRKQLQAGRILAAVVDGHADQDVVRSRLGVLQEDVEIPVVVEDPRVDELVFELLPRPPPVRVEEVTVGELALRVLVEVLHVRVGRRRVEVEVVLLHVLAVVPLAVGEAERALLEDGIPLVPEGEGEAETLLVVGDPAQPVLAPPVGPGAGLVVREVVPGVAVLAVVLADRPPLPLAQVGSPLLPGGPRLAGVVQPLPLGAIDDAGSRRLLARHGGVPRFRGCRGSWVTVGGPGKDRIPAVSRPSSCTRRERPRGDSGYPSGSRRSPRASARATRSLRPPVAPRAGARPRREGGNATRVGPAGRPLRERWHSFRRRATVHRASV